MSLIFYDRSKHNTCAAGVQSSSSSAAGDRFWARSRRKSSSSACLQLAGEQEREADVKAGQDSIFCNLGLFENILKFWELLGNSELTLSLKTQERGCHVTVERTLTRLKIIFRSVVGNSDSTSEVKNPGSTEIWKIWENLGKFGKIWDFGNLRPLPLV